MDDRAVGWAGDGSILPGRHGASRVTAVLRQPPSRLTIYSLLVLGLSMTAACKEDAVRPTMAVTAADSADQVLEGMEHLITNDGVRRTKVIADTAYLYEATQLARLKAVTSTFYNTNGNETSTITADSGNYQMRDGSMSAWGHVVAVTPDGRTLHSAELRYEIALRHLRRAEALETLFQRGRHRQALGVQLLVDIAVDPQLPHARHVARRRAVAEAVQHMQGLGLGGGRGQRDGGEQRERQQRECLAQIAKCHVAFLSKVPVPTAIAAPIDQSLAPRGPKSRADASVARADSNTQAHITGA